MQIAQGPHFLDGTLTFTVDTHRFDTGAATDADSVPAYRVYEDTTDTPILTDNMAKLDDANTTGLYRAQISLTAANGFEAGKTYTIRVTATVNSVTGGISGSFTLSDRYRLGIIDEGTAQGAGANSIQLRAGAAFADDELVGAIVLITGGTGVGQARQITDYAGATDTATVDAWTTTPGGTITYVIFAAVAPQGVAQTGDAYARLGAPAGASIAADLATVDTVADAIKAKTDSLTFTQAGHVDANVQRINDVVITGDGSGTPFGV